MSDELNSKMLAVSISNNNIRKEVKEFAKHAMASLVAIYPGDIEQVTELAIKQSEHLLNAIDAKYNIPVFRNGGD